MSVHKASQPKTNMIVFQGNGSVSTTVHHLLHQSQSDECMFLISAKQLVRLSIDIEPTETLHRSYLYGLSM